MHLDQTTLPLSDVANMDVDNHPSTLTDGGSLTSRSPSIEALPFTTNSATVRNKDNGTLPQYSARGGDKEKTSARVKEEPVDTQPNAAIVSLSLLRLSLLI